MNNYLSLVELKKAINEKQGIYVHYVDLENGVIVSYVYAVDNFNAVIVVAEHMQNLSNALHRELPMVFTTSTSMGLEANIVAAYDPMDIIVFAEGCRH